MLHSGWEIAIVYNCQKGAAHLNVPYHNPLGPNAEVSDSQPLKPLAPQVFSSIPPSLLATPTNFRLSACRSPQAQSPFPTRSPPAQPKTTHTIPSPPSPASSIPKSLSPHLPHLNSPS